MYCQSVNLAIHISSDFNPTDKHRSCFTSPTVLTYCTTCFFGGGRHSSFHSLILWLLGVLPRFLGSLFWEMLVADLSASVVLRELLAACIERSRQIGAEHTCTFYTACPHTWHTCTTSICPNRAQLLAWGMFQQGQTARLQRKHWPVLSGHLSSISPSCHEIASIQRFWGDLIPRSCDSRWDALTNPKQVPWTRGRKTRFINGFLHSEVGGWTFAILHKVIEMWPDAGSFTTLCSNN